MTSAKSHGAVAALGASVSDQLWRQVIAENKRQQQFAQAPIRVTLIGFDRCEAAGISVCGCYAPVLDLCRELVAAGFDSACPLEAWRGQTLCMRVCSIGEGARLTVADDRHVHLAFGAGRSARKGMPRARRFGKREAPLPQHLHTRSSAGAGDNGEPKTHSRDGSAREAFLAEGAGRTRELQILCAAIAASGAHLILGRQNREKING
jgi:hypothetical protein